MSKNESDLQKKLRKKIDDAGISAHMLEKQAGLKRSAVQNILYGKSKRPSAEILGAITKVLGCSINDLLGHQESNPAIDINYRMKSIESTDSAHTLDTNLYAKAVQIANMIFSNNQITATKQEALVFIDEIYQYSLNNNMTDIDLNFAEWLVKRCWSKN